MKLAYQKRHRPLYSKLKRVSTSVEWFEIYEITTNLFVFYEPRHCEEAISNLVIGENKAVLIDTGCGIGNLRKAVKAVTDKPLVVINTHTHTDHLGSNRQFDNIVMFDHPLSRQISSQGISSKIMHAEILEESLIVKPWPKGFNPEGYSLPPFKVNHWLEEGSRIDLGNRILEVIHTPGEAPDHICLLDKTDRILFCGDLLVRGSLWTHLEGGSLKDLKESYIKLLDYIDDFDQIMPSHNEPCLDKGYLTESLAGVKSVLSGQAEFKPITDPWGKQLKQYTFDRFSILTL